MMINFATFVFYAELKDFLTKPERFKSIQKKFNDNPAIKDAIESLGPPHTEVAAIKVNDQYVDFNYCVRANDDCHIFPHSMRESLNDNFCQDLMPKGTPGFILDVHLGGLARYMRMLGFDTVYSAIDMGDENIANIAQQQQRIVVTRDIGILKRTAIEFGIWLRSDESRTQLAEVIQRYALTPYFNPFSRCLRCNGQLETVSQNEVVNRVPPRIATSHQQFRQCMSCGKVYWPGTHHQRMQVLISKYLGENQN